MTNNRPVPMGERWICPRCTGLNGAHFLTCPVLRAPARVAIPFDDGSGDEDVTP